MTAITVAWITLIGAIVSAGVSLLTTRHMIIHEKDKLFMQWEHESDVASEKEFAEMVSAVARYVDRDLTTYQNEAVRLIAAERVKHTGEIGNLLDNLYSIVLNGPHERIDSALTAAIDEKRREK